MNNRLELATLVEMSKLQVEKESKVLILGCVLHADRSKKWIPEMHEPQLISPDEPWKFTPYEQWRMFAVPDTWTEAFLDRYELPFRSARYFGVNRVRYHTVRTWARVRYRMHIWRHRAQPILVAVVAGAAASAIGGAILLLLN